MVFKKREQLIGLDIGSSHIKVAELKDSGKGIRLHKLGIAALPFGLVEEGRIIDVDGTAGVIRQLFREQRIKKKNVAISTGGYSVVIKTIVVPTATEKDLVGNIRQEAEQYIPYDIDDVNIDFQILGPSEFSTDQMNVLLVAVKKDLVAEYIDLANQAGLNPCVIDVDSFALQNIFEMIYNPSDTTGTLLVDVGASKISMNILKGSVSQMMRDNSSGTDQIREAVMKELGCPPEHAEKILAGNQTGEIAESKLKEIYNSALNGWCSEIQAVVKTLQTKSSDIRIDQILVSGGGAYAAGFVNLLGTQIAAPAAIIDPFRGIRLDPRQFPEDLLKRCAAQVAIAMGLSLRKTDDK